MKEVNLLFIDDEILLVQGIKSLFNQNRIRGIVAGDHYLDLKAFIDDELQKCDLVITDLDIQNPKVIEHVPAIKKKYPKARVIVLTNFNNFKLVRDTMKAGADGYMLKKSSFGELIKCIEEVLDGEAHIGKGIQLAPSKNLFDKVEKDSQPVRKYEDRYQVRQKLTKRELEILKLVTQAKSNREIADELFISDQTVGVHKKNIMRKLNVRSTISLIKYAMEQNLV